MSRDRLNRWNDIVDGLKPVVSSVVARKTATAVREDDLPPEFENDVRWDILHLCIEMEYSDIIILGGYAGLAHWYLAGHFPCGWHGTPPKGKLILY